MLARLSAIAATMAILLAVGLPLAAASPPRAQSLETDLSTICPLPPTPTVSVERFAVLAAVADAIAVTALAVQPAEQLPEGTDFALSLDRVTIEARTETKYRRTVGPTLFLVQEGILDVIDSGRPRALAARPGVSSGASTLVERNRLVKLRNQSDQQTRVLLLGLLPPAGSLPIGATPPESIWVDFPEERERLTHDRMLSAGVGALAREETLLFAACLHWTESTAEVAPTRYPGPVGVLVLRGQALVNRTARINAGECWVSPGFSPLQIGAGEQPPALVFFGAVKSTAQPQSALDVAPNLVPLDCAGPDSTSRQ